MPMMLSKVIGCCQQVVVVIGLLGGIYLLRNVHQVLLLWRNASLLEPIFGELLETISKICTYDFCIEMCADTLGGGGGDLYFS
jgi:hypothetical protein